MTSADSTLFSNNDLSEPGFAAQVVATSRVSKRFIPTHISLERRVFNNSAHENDMPGWKDSHGYFYYFEDLRDIVILNRGIEK